MSAQELRDFAEMLDYMRGRVSAMLGEESETENVSEFVETQIIDRVPQKPKNVYEDPNLNMHPDLFFEILASRINPNSVHKDYEIRIESYTIVVSEVPNRLGNRPRMKYREHLPGSMALLLNKIAEAGKTKWEHCFPLHSDYKDLIVRLY